MRFDYDNDRTDQGIEPADRAAVGTEEMNDTVKLARQFADILLAELDRLDSIES